jgi:hypothetical protein
MWHTPGREGEKKVVEEEGGEGEECMQNFVEKARRKETTRKTKT